MKNTFTIFKKEMRRFYTDPRMLLALFLPGILIFVLYSVMGRVFTSVFKEVAVENTSYRIAYTDNYGGGEKPKIVLAYDAYLANTESEKTNSVVYTVIPSSEVEQTKEAIRAGTYDLLVVFSDDFEVTINTDVATPLSNYVLLYYNGEQAAGSKVYSIMNSLVDAVYKNYVVNIDSQGQPITPNLGKSDYQGAKVLSIIVPMLTMSMLFSSVMSICPDAIAGEKERGTLSAMLLTPIKRSELVLGKILALMITAALSGLTSFLGLLGGLPAMMTGLNISLAPGTIVLLGVLIVTTLLLFVSLGTVVSTIAKSVKECSSYMAPMMVIAMAVAFLPLAITNPGIFFAFIPFLNVSLCMNQLLVSGAIGVGFITATIASNVVFAGLLIYAVSRLFRVERIMIL